MDHFITSMEWNGRVVWSPTRLAAACQPLAGSSSISWSTPFHSFFHSHYFLISVSLVITLLFHNPPRPQSFYPPSVFCTRSKLVTQSRAEQKYPNKMPVGEMFLSAVTQVLIDRLVSLLLLEFATRQGIRSHLEKLKSNLEMITQVITHAENMLVRESRVNEWLEKVRDWAYHADDFLDEVNTRAMQEEEDEARGNRDSTLGKRKRPGQAWIFRKVLDVAFGFIYGTQYSKGVDELNSRLDTICERMDEMRRLMKMTLHTHNTSTPPLPILQRPLEATAHAFDARVFGREQEKETIIEQLKSSRDTAVEVIPIVGMPGIGKTTLARHVFNSVKKKQHEQELPLLFDIKGWVCVSDDFDVIRITRDILESFTRRAYDLRGLNQLQSELKEVVEGKRFLLVLDDVWSRNYSEHWDALRRPFGVGAPGSKILVTTRDNKVASMMQTDDPMKIHRPRPLCDNDCWRVFLQHVIDRRNPDFESEAGCFRMKILDRCRGLPLTAKLLAGILRGESPGQGWEAKLKSSIWDLSENELPGRKGDGMLPVVMLSYFHLPANLKRCFSYCSVLPEDYEFGEEEIVLMWMAQGLVLPDRGEQVEVTGATYFRELVSRSLFQPSPNDPSRFLMHDLINDMAEMVAGKSCLKFDGNLKMDNIPAQARYLSFRNITLKMEFEAFERTKYLRAFQSFHHAPFDLTSYVTFELLMKLKYLRVLCLSWQSVRELPKDIGDLIHLRLVDLSYTDIRRLPESTSSLYNLQTLKLKRCFRLETLPSQMRKLINLRNLDCSDSSSLVAMPVEMGKLTSLQKLSNFIVGKGLEQGVGQLKYLSRLKGSISISSLQNVCDSKEAREARLKSKDGLRSLELKWNSDHGDLQGTGASFHVLVELQPHKHLEELIIRGYCGFLFPGWVGYDRFSKMRMVELANCGKCTSLPPLGKLPVLEEIQIRDMGGIECVREEFYGKDRGAFPSLKFLKFESMENWSTWLYPAGGGCSFACLQELHVINCPKLSLSLPDCINVQKLYVRKCDELLVALPRQSILEMNIAECKVELMGCLNEGGNASQLLPSVITSLKVEKVDVVEAVGSASMRMNIISHEDVVGAHQRMMMLGSLTALEMASIPKLTHLPGVVLQGLPKLEQLRICRCEELTSLWKKQKSHFLNSLRVLVVLECCQLVCLVPQRGEEDLDDTERDTDISEEKEEETRGKQQCLGLPCGLETLRLSRCAKLEKLPSDLNNLTSLRSVSVQNCFCLRLSCLPEMGFPSTLESLLISGFELLTCLSSSSSSSSSSVAMGMGANGNGIMPLPHSLKRMDIWNCKNVESLAVGSTAFTSAGSSSSLESVNIRDCPKLKSLPEGLIHRRLKNLSIQGCQHLGDLSISTAHHHFTALEYLSISGWPAGLLSIQQGQGGPNPNSLPPNLRSLTIDGPLVTPNDQQLFSVPLPPSLTTLRIYNFKKLSREAFQNATSLQELFIWECPGLTSIPDQWLLPSLRFLSISDCPALTSIPDQLRLPSLRSLHIRHCPALTSIQDQLLLPSLRSLHINDCSLLAPEFAKGKGRYWPKVKFIPQVHIDRRSIFD